MLESIISLQTGEIWLLFIDIPYSTNKICILLLSYNDQCFSFHICLKLNRIVPNDFLFPRLILTFEVTESRFDRDSAGSEVEEEEVGEGTPQSNAMTEGDYIPDSPASSPIELKQELPKYLPALQVEDLLEVLEHGIRK